MPIDREETLRKAEKLLRQGRLDAALAEYARVVEDHPKDWATANTLGDLYVRAGRLDRAVEQFLRIADHFFQEGFVPKAIALYKKILKIKPDHEEAQLQLAEASARQGLLADAKMYLSGVAARRRQSGDRYGADEVVARLGALDQNDFEARLNGARALVSLGDVGGGVERLRQLADDLAEKDRDTEALDVLREIVRLDETDVAGRGRVARACLTAGDLEGAREYLTSDVAGDDPVLMAALAEIELRGGHLEAGAELVRRALDLDSTVRDRVMELGMRLCGESPEAAFACIDAMADVDAAAQDWAAAAASLHEFVSRVPNQVPALMKLVEICVDGGLEGTMYVAQAQLTDAYLATSRAAEARVIAEDLVAREPWEKAHIERFRQALIMLGEQDPDAIVAERLSGEIPFTSTDHFGRTDTPAPAVELSGVAAPAPEREPEAPPAVLAPAAAPAEGAGAADEHDGIDIAALLREVEAVESMSAQPDAMEVDLTTVLTDLSPGAPPEGRAPKAPATSLGDVFRDFREEVSRGEADESAGQQWKLAQTYREMGMTHEAIGALQAAARSPRHRFEAASALGRIYREQGLAGQAVEWFERAAEAPAPNPADGHALLYELGDTLERVGEVARALAVFLELAADAEAYRDVHKRIERLSKVQAGG